MARKLAGKVAASFAITQSPARSNPVNAVLDVPAWIDDQQACVAGR